MAVNASRVAQLERVSLPRLLFALLRQRFTGVVQLDQPPPTAGRRSVWIAGGMPVFTDWYSATDVFGRVATECADVSDDQIARALQTAAAERIRIGEALVRQGSLSDTSLKACLKEQCKRKLVHLFALQRGEATLAAGNHPHAQAFHQLNALEVIAEGIGAHYDDERIEREMGSAELAGQLVATQALQRYVSHFRLPESELPAIGLLSRGCDVRAIVDSTNLPPRRAKQLVFTLWACQMLHVGRQAQEASAQPSTARRSVPAPSASTSQLRLPTRNDYAPPPASMASTTAGRRPRTGDTSGPAPASKPPSAGPVQRQAPPSAPPQTSAARSPSPASAEPLRPIPVREAHAQPRVSSAPPSIPAGAPDRFLAQLELYEQRIAARAHAFELLGCPLECGRTEVRTAWVNLSRVFHPDALPARGLSHLRDRVSRVFAALSEANMILSNNAEREKLRQEIQRGHHGADIPDATAMAHAALQSELIAREADRLLRANKFERARARYEEATKLTPDEPDLHAAIVWCDYNLSGKSLADQTLAIKKLGEVVDSNQRLARAHYFRGLVLKDANDVNGAIVSFTLAHEYDKRLIDAERQARALRARRGPTTRQPSTTERARRGLMGLFGKK